MIWHLLTPRQLLAVLVLLSAACCGLAAFAWVFGG